MFCACFKALIYDCDNSVKFGYTNSSSNQYMPTVSYVIVLKSLHLQQSALLLDTALKNLPNLTAK